MTQITDDEATMEHRPLLQDKEVLQVPLGQLSKWRVSKAQMPQLCPQDLAAAIIGHACQPIEEEWTKANLTWQLHHAYEQHAVDVFKVGFGIHPQELLTLQHVKKGQLKLVPLGTLAKAKPGQIPKGPAIIHAGVTWIISPFKQNTTFSNESTAGGLIPAWWVKATKEEEESNMTWQHISMEGNLKIPCLGNPAAVPKGQALQYLLEAAGSGGPPAKKAKK